MLKTYLVLLSLCFMFTACQENREETYSPKYSKVIPKLHKEYIFGVHPLHNPVRLHEVYQPLVEYINKHLNGPTLRFEASKKYSHFDKKLAHRHFDFALPNPYQTIQSLKYGYHVFGKMGQDENFRGLILIRKDSGITKISDLKGKKFSCPAPTALAATMMPEWFLYKQGLNVTKDLQTLYVGSQESSIMNVYLKKSSAGSTWIPPWRSFQKRRPKLAKEMIAKWITPPLLNNSLVARDDVPAALIKKISFLIFNLHKHKEGLKILERMELTHYEKATDATYEVIINFIKNYSKHIRVLGKEP